MSSSSSESVRGGVSVLVEGSPKGGGSALAGVGPCHGIEGGAVVEDADLGLVERSLQRGEASQTRGRRACGRRRARMPWCSVTSPTCSVGARWIRSPGRLVRPPALRTVTSIRVALVGRISHSAAADAWSAPRPARLPARPCAARRRQHAMPDRVDAAVNPMQPPRGGPVRHRPLREAERGELARRDDPVLALREHRDSLIDDFQRLASGNRR